MSITAVDEGGWGGGGMAAGGNGGIGGEWGDREYVGGGEKGGASSPQRQAAAQARTAQPTSGADVANMAKSAFGSEKRGVAGERG